MKATAPVVLIVGAGPTGRLLVHARTLELHDRHGLAVPVVARGEVVRGKTCAGPGG